MKNLTITIFFLVLIISCTQKSNENLIEAVKNADFEKVKKIVTAENINSTDETGATPAMWAAYNDDAELLDFLVKNGADVRKRGIIGINQKYVPKTYTSTLGAAAGEGNLETVKYLIEKAGVSPDERGDCLNYWNVLPNEIKTMDGVLEFLEKSNDELSELIKSSELYESIKPKEIKPSKSPVFNDFLKASNEAERRDAFATILSNIILEKDLKNRDVDPYAVRRMAVNRRIIDEILKDFVRKKDSYDYRKSSEGEPPVLTAVFRRKNNIVDYLISQKADLNAKDCRGLTPAMAAAMASNYDGLKKLLENGAKANTYWNLRNQKTTVLSQLMTMYFHGTRTEKEREGIKKVLPLLWKTEQDFAESIDVFPNPLLKPCRLKTPSMIEIFMENGADYSKIKNNGRTLKEICADDGIEIKDEWLKKKEQE